jgi:hypothetical protein
VAACQCAPEYALPCHGAMLSVLSCLSCPGAVLITTRGGEVEASYLTLQQVEERGADLKAFVRDARAQLQLLQVCGLRQRGSLLQQSCQQRSCLWKLHSMLWLIPALTCTLRAGGASARAISERASSLDSLICCADQACLSPAPCSADSHPGDGPWPQAFLWSALAGVGDHQCCCQRQASGELSATGCAWQQLVSAHVP